MITIFALFLILAAVGALAALCFDLLVTLMRRTLEYLDNTKE